MINTVDWKLVKKNLNDVIFGQEEVIHNIIDYIKNPFYTNKNVPVITSNDADGVTHGVCDLPLSRMDC